MLTDPALNIVVYPDPGPPDDTIGDHSRSILLRKSICGTGGGLGYLVLETPDFDRLWSGVDRGDARGAATDVLHQLGPGGHPFIDREVDFIYGWNGDDGEEGRILMLQIIPRPHMVAVIQAERN